MKITIARLHLPETLFALAMLGLFYLIGGLVFTPGTTETNCPRLAVGQTVIVNGRADGKIIGTQGPDYVVQYAGPVGWYGAWEQGRARFTGCELGVR